MKIWIPLVLAAGSLTSPALATSQGTADEAIIAAKKELAEAQAHLEELLAAKEASRIVTATTAAAPEIQWKVVGQKGGNCQEQQGDCQEPKAKAHKGVWGDKGPREIEVHVSGVPSMGDFFQEGHAPQVRVRTLMMDDKGEVHEFQGGEGGVGEWFPRHPMGAGAPQGKMNRGGGHPMHPGMMGGGAPMFMGGPAGDCRCDCMGDGRQEAPRAPQKMQLRKMMFAGPGADSQPHHMMFMGGGKGAPQGMREMILKKMGQHKQEASGMWFGQRGEAKHQEGGWHRGGGDSWFGKGDRGHGQGGHGWWTDGDRERDFPVELFFEECEEGPGQSGMQFGGGHGFDFERMVQDDFDCEGPGDCQDAFIFEDYDASCDEAGECEDFTFDCQEIAKCEDSGSDCSAPKEGSCEAESDCDGGGCEEAQTFAIALTDDEPNWVLGTTGAVNIECEEDFDAELDGLLKQLGADHGQAQIIFMSDDDDEGCAPSSSSCEIEEITCDGTEGLNAVDIDAEIQVLLKELGADGGDAQIIVMSNGKLPSGTKAMDCVVMGDDDCKLDSADCDSGSCDTEGCDMDSDSCEVEVEVCDAAVDAVPCTVAADVDVDAEIDALIREIEADTVVEEPILMDGAVDATPSDAKARIAELESEVADLRDLVESLVKELNKR